MSRLGEAKDELSLVDKSKWVKMVYTGIDGVLVKNLKNHEVHHKPWRGNASAYFKLADNRTIDAHISELPPGGCSKKHRHINEAIIYILSGKGYTIIHKEGEPEKKYEWEEGDLLSVPLFAWHQHFNADPNKPARYLAITNVPLMKMLKVLKIEQWKEKEA